jgi:signal peptide peptidase SppA
MRYEHIFAEVFRKPWAILPDKFRVIAEIVHLRASGQKLTEEEIRARLSESRDGIQAAAARSGKGYGTVAVIPIYGVISQRMNLMSQFSGGTSVEKLSSQLRAALADTNVSSIVLDVDSPGGGVEGIPELADEIIAGRSQKKIVAVANTMAASAAYWLACCASELVVAPSGQVGSIGVFAAHEDVSEALKQEGVKVSLVSAGKFKTEGNPYEPLSDEARAELQSKVDGFYEMFIKAVARGRGVSQASVRGGYGQGRMLMAGAAVTEGMADRVATFDQVLAKLGAKPANAAVAIAEGQQPDLAARDARRSHELDLY